MPIWVVSTADDVEIYRVFGIDLDDAKRSARRSAIVRNEARFSKTIKFRKVDR